MQPSDHRSIELVDAIIVTLSNWDKYEDYYLGTLIPLIETGDVPRGSAIADIAAALRKRLTPEELHRLPQTVAARRAGKEMSDEEFARALQLKLAARRQADKEERERRQQADVEERERRQQADVEERKRRQQAEAARKQAEKEERERRQQAEAARKQAEKEERERRQQEVRQREEAFAARARSVLQSHFLEADQRLAQDPDFTLFADDAYPELKSDFVSEWARRELKEDLDDEQAAAVGATGHDVQVVARAGAGKTRTLVTRALFLQRHCGVSPSDLLLLAFNRDAASEMRERLGRSLEHGVPHVMTFHALAHAMVHPEEELLVDDPSAGNLGLSREVQRVIDEHLQSDHHRPLIRDLMLMQFREDWERIIKGGFHLPIDELIAYRSSLPRETLRGDYVKSFGERLIANTLFEHEIDYKYERNFRWGGVNYRPDFTIPFANGGGIVIEYFGLKGQPDYDASSANKRAFWAQQRQWAFLEFSPSTLASMGVEGFSAHLLEQLAQLGVKGRRLSDEELWERIQRRAVDRFTGAMRSFVSRCRKQNLTPEDLGRIALSHTSITEAEQLFLEVGTSVYSEYVRRLAAAGQEDFDGLMWRAVAMLAGGHSGFVRDKGRERGDLRRMRFILIDEFQDFSDLFYGLTQGIRALNPQVEFFCVGDDWQAINGFAGSDLRFFDDFAGHFKDTKRLHVSTNYRSPTRVVEVGNALMTGRGAPAVPDRSDSGWVSAARFSDFTPSAAEQERHDGDDATPALLRLVKSQLDAGRDVVMLSRRNGVPWYVSYAPELPRTLDGLQRFAEHIRSFLPEEDRGRVTASTAHKYKGLEKEAVIILDADMGSYPLIHPNWVFLRLFGDTVERIEAEERRLFYVALTRSRHSLLIMSDDESRESQYVGDIRRRSRLELVDWDEFAPVPSLDGARVEVRVFNAYDVRDELKLLRFRWNDRGKYWHRSFTEADFGFSSLCRQAWAQTGVGIEVYSEDGRLLNAKPNTDST